MGEAKRRAQLDPNYGKIPNLSTSTLKTQQAEKILTELFRHFSLELRKLTTAPSFPDDYPQISNRLTDWLHHRLNQYHESDRQYLAQFIFGLIAHLNDESVVDEFGFQKDVSPVLLCCFFQATKPYFDHQALASLEHHLTQSLAQLPKTQGAAPFAKSILQELQQQLASSELNQSID